MLAHSAECSPGHTNRFGSEGIRSIHLAFPSPDRKFNNFVVKRYKVAMAEIEAGVRARHQQRAMSTANEIAHKLSDTLILQLDNAVAWEQVYGIVHSLLRDFSLSPSDSELTTVSWVMNPSVRPSGG